ncbi:MAG: hypothetical protein HYX39_05725 [Bacteroidetes bacterium]|nr:hypothetical protein [Bacteroidota bacterium]
MELKPLRASLLTASAELKASRTELKASRASLLTASAELKALRASLLTTNAELKASQMELKPSRASLLKGIHNNIFCLIYKFTCLKAACCAIGFFYKI